MVATVSRDELVSGLVRIGEMELTARTRPGSTPTSRLTSRSMGPDGREWGPRRPPGLLRALRAAFDDLTITRGIVVAEGDYVACQTTIAGTFMREFTHSPVGACRRTGSGSPSS